MRVGLMTNILVQEGLKDFSALAEWAEQNGFEDLEVGPTIPLDRAVYEKVMGRGGIRVSSLTYCRNFLSTDAREATLHREELRKRIVFAGELGIEKVVTSTGINKSLEEGVYDRADAIRRIPARSLDEVREVFLPLVELAEKHKVKIAFENCPLMGNIAISPVLWRRLFELLDSPNAGIAYDPSHLVWEMIDPYAPVAEFAGRIFHVHAKDAQIDRTRLAQTGILTDFSWWKYRIPGRGELHWKRLIGELRKIGYDGTISLEHEDEDYTGSLSRVKEGLLLGRACLEAALTSQGSALERKESE